MFEPMSARFASSCSRNGISAGGDRDELLRRDVHVVDFARLDFEEVAAVADAHLVDGEVALLVDRRIGLRDDELALPGRR